MVLLLLLLPLLVVIATGRVIWKSFTGNLCLQRAKMPQALVWPIWGCATRGRAVQEEGTEVRLRGSSGRLSRWSSLQNGSYLHV